MIYVAAKSTLPYSTCMILVGIRSPIVVEYEETCRRCKIDITMAVSVSGVPRSLARKQVVDIADLTRPVSDDTFIACAFSSQRRAELVEIALSLGLEAAPALIDPNATVAQSARIDSASYLNAGTIVGAVTSIGSGVLLNRCASVGHHCVLEDYVSLGPGATLCGNIQVGYGATIGAGATVLPDLRIGKGALIAGGSLVREHVADGDFVAGNPARRRPFDSSKSSLNIPGGE